MVLKISKFLFRKLVKIKFFTSKPSGLSDEVFKTEIISVITEEYMRGFHVRLKVLKTAILRVIIADKNNQEKAR